MKRSHRGLTLIEVLAALALLGLLAAALSSWLQVTSGFASKAATTLPWESAAERSMQCIERDLIVGDFADVKGTPKEPRCRVTDNRLMVLTRDPQHGPALHEYRFDSSTESLIQVSRPGQLPTGPAITRRLIGDVAGWTCDLDAETQRLAISLRSINDLTMRWSFACPP